MLPASKHQRFMHIHQLSFNLIKINFNFLPNIYSSFRLKYTRHVKSTYINEHSVNDGTRFYLNITSGEIIHNLFVQMIRKLVRNGRCDGNYKLNSYVLQWFRNKMKKVLRRLLSPWYLVKDAHHGSKKFYVSYLKYLTFFIYDRI